MEEHQNRRAILQSMNSDRQYEVLLKMQRAGGGEQVSKEAKMARKRLTTGHDAQAEDLAALDVDLKSMADVSRLSGAEINALRSDALIFLYGGVTYSDFREVCYDAPARPNYRNALRARRLRLIEAISLEEISISNMERQEIEHLKVLSYQYFSMALSSLCAGALRQSYHPDDEDAKVMDRFLMGDAKVGVGREFVGVNSGLATNGGPSSQGHNDDYLDVWCPPGTFDSSVKEALSGVSRDEIDYWGGDQVNREHKLNFYTVKSQRAREENYTENTRTLRVKRYLDTMTHFRYEVRPSARSIRSNAAPGGKFSAPFFGLSVLDYHKPESFTTRMGFNLRFASTYRFPTRMSMDTPGWPLHQTQKYFAQRYYNAPGMDTPGRMQAWKIPIARRNADLATTEQNYGFQESSTPQFSGMVFAPDYFYPGHINYDEHGGYYDPVDKITGALDTIATDFDGGDLYNIDEIRNSLGVLVRLCGTHWARALNIPPWMSWPAVSVGHPQRDEPAVLPSSVNRMNASRSNPLSHYVNAENGDYKNRKWARPATDAAHFIYGSLYHKVTTNATVKINILNDTPRASALQAASDDHPDDWKMDARFRNCNQRRAVNPQYPMMDDANADVAPPFFYGHGHIIFNSAWVTFALVIGTRRVFNKIQETKFRVVLAAPVRSLGGSEYNRRSYPSPALEAKQNLDNLSVFTVERVGVPPNRTINQASHRVDRWGVARIKLRSHLQYGRRIMPTGYTGFSALARGVEGKQTPHSDDTFGFDWTNDGLELDILASKVMGIYIGLLYAMHKEKKKLMRRVDISNRDSPVLFYPVFVCTDVRGKPEEMQNRASYGRPSINPFSKFTSKREDEVRNSPPRGELPNYFSPIRFHRTKEFAFPELAFQLGYDSTFMGEFLRPEPPPPVNSSSSSSSSTVNADFNKNTPWFARASGLDNRYSVTQHLTFLFRRLVLLLSDIRESLNGEDGDQGSGVINGRYLIDIHWWSILKSNGLDKKHVFENQRHNDIYLPSVPYNFNLNLGGLGGSEDGELAEEGEIGNDSPGLQGSGGGKVSIQEGYKSHNIIQTWDYTSHGDHSCLARALTLLLHFTLQSKTPRPNDSSKLLRDGRRGENYNSVSSQRLRAEALKLSREAKIPVSKACGVPEILRFREVLTTFLPMGITAHIQVFETHGNGLAMTYCTHDTKEFDNLPGEAADIMWDNIMWFNLLLVNGHFVGISRIHSLLNGATKYCYKCKKAYSSKIHACLKKTCSMCQSTEDHYALYLDTKDPDQWLHCDSCDRNFYTQACFDTHSGSCNKRWKCTQCNKLFYTGGKSGQTKDSHICGTYFCKNCALYKFPDHHCFMKTLDVVPKHKSKGYLFSDFECTQEGEEHVVNLAVTQDSHGNQWVHHSIHEWVNWMLSAAWGQTIIFHNGKGYDFQFIFRELLSKERPTQHPVSVVRQGTKIILLTLAKKRRFSPATGIRLVDSLNFLPMALKKFTKTFGLTTKKGFYPHFFNTKENMTYIGCIPPQKDFGSMYMDSNTSVEFNEWYVERAKTPWDNYKELLAYCEADVTLLREGVLKFIREVILATGGHDPFTKTTLASSALHIFRACYMIPESVVCFLPDMVRFLRRGLAGGRTGPTKLYRRALKDEKIHYIDFTSMYPYVCKYGEYPLGAPSYIGNPVYYEEYLQKPGVGIWEVDLTCPNNLYHPLLHHKNPDVSLLLFDLMPKKNQIYTSLELKKALTLGYKITKVHKVIHWNNTVKGIFKRYIDTFLKMKQESAGWPAGCLSEEDKKNYLSEYKNREGIQLDPKNIQKNPGRYGVSKLYLNSLWGKFAQRLSEEFSSTKCFYNTPEDISAFQRVQTEAKNLVMIKDSAIIADLPGDIPDPKQTVGTTNIALAMFTSAQARLKLYEDILQPLGERVLYYDTDSAIFVAKNSETKWLDTVVPLGRYLGDLTNELGSDKYSFDNGTHIIEYCSGGPKNYAYVTNHDKTCTKVKGLSLRSVKAKSWINFEAVKAQVLHKQTIFMAEKNIVRNKFHQVMTVDRHKVYRYQYRKRQRGTPAYDEEGLIMEIDTKPWFDISSVPAHMAPQTPFQLQINRFQNPDQSHLYIYKNLEASTIDDNDTEIKANNDSFIITFSPRISQSAWLVYSSDFPSDLDLIFNFLGKYEDNVNPDYNSDALMLTLALTIFENAPTGPSLSIATRCKPDDVSEELKNAMSGRQMLTFIQ